MDPSEDNLQALESRNIDSIFIFNFSFLFRTKNSNMVILKNEEQIFDDNSYKDWNWLFFNNKEADCILYSEDGHGFRIHREILSQTEKMRNILISFKDNCCGMMEILCPCPKDELEQLVKFLYSGIISFNVDLLKILDNLITIFGFPENLTLNNGHGKEFNRDEFLTKDIKHEKSITGANSETISVQTNAYIDADHAGNKITRKSQTGILIFCNMAPVIWYSKRQNTVETSTFGSEYIALRTGTEMIIALRYKLRMTGVPLDGPTNVFCDNESVVKSSVNPETTLKKKHVSIAFHKCRDSFAAGVINVFFQRSSENLADLFTKVLPVDKRKEIFRGIFF